MYGQLSQALLPAEDPHSFKRRICQRQGSLGDSLRNCIQSQSSLRWGSQEKAKEGDSEVKRNRGVLTEIAPRPGVHLPAATAS